MPNPLPILVFDELNPSIAGGVKHTDLRTLNEWRELVTKYVKEWVNEMLVATDWYVVRELDSSGGKGKGKKIPSQIKAKRVVLLDTLESLEGQMVLATTLAEFDLIPWSTTLAALDPNKPTFDFTL